MSKTESLTGRLVNDVHSGLNATNVHRIVEVRSIAEIRAAIHSAAALQQRVTICGGRHAMGGQQFGDGALLLDMGRMDRVLGFDRDKGLVEVEAGIQWPALIDYLV